MKTYPVAKEAMAPFAFEVEHIFVPRRTIARLLTTVAGVSEVRLRGRFSSADDIRVAFTYFDRDYIVEEPHGDNSRYWIGPAIHDDGGPAPPDIRPIMSVFENHSRWPATLLRSPVGLTLSMVAWTAAVYTHSSYGSWHIYPALVVLPLVFMSHAMLIASRKPKSPQVLFAVVHLVVCAPLWVWCLMLISKDSF